MTKAEVRLRSTASTTGTVVALLPLGAKGIVEEGPKSAGGYVWYRIATSLGTGWVIGANLKASSGTVATATPTGITIGSNVVVNDNDVRLRQTPSLSGTVITTLNAGTRGTVVDGPRSNDGYRWFRISTTFGTGWVAARYLSLA